MEKTRAGTERAKHVQEGPRGRTPRRNDGVLNIKSRTSW